MFSVFLFPFPLSHGIVILREPKNLKICVMGTNAFTMTGNKTVTNKLQCYEYRRKNGSVEA